MYARLGFTETILLNHQDCLYLLADPSFTLQTYFFKPYLQNISANVFRINLQRVISAQAGMGVKE